MTSLQLASSQADQYVLIAKILRACVLTDKQRDTGLEAAVAASRELRLTIEARLERAGHPATLTDERVFDRLKEALTELKEWAEDVPGTESRAEYKHLRFIQHALCQPPTVARLLARNFGVSEATVADWLEDSPNLDTRALVDKVLGYVTELCAEAEVPESGQIPETMESFDELLFLGGLRHVFKTIYGTAKPKQAQARYLPRVLQRMADRFQQSGSGRTLVVAPTNGGKNGIILGAALGALAWDEGPVLVLQPHRAQISESVRTWNEGVTGTQIRRTRTASSSRLRVAGSSAIMSDLDYDILHGRIDLTAIIPEKLAVLSRNTQLSTFCRLLVADEIGQLFSQERGPKLEIMLTLALEADLGILAVGAAVSSPAAANVARWLAGLAQADDPRESGALLFDPNLKRDPAIEYWVWRRDGRRRFWRDGLGPLDETSDVVEELPEHEEDAVAELVLRELSQSPQRQILVFVENREKVVDLADSIARAIRAAGDTLAEKLSDLVGEKDTAPLSQIWLGGALPAPVDIASVLAQRVGVHTRDVPSNNLERIEAAFRSGRLRVLCATTTVEAGINLPVDTVVQVGLLDHEKKKLSQRALEQRLGRSGRTLPGRDLPGKGIVYVHDESQSIDRVIQERLLKQDDRSDSQLTEEYRALLVLTFIGTANDKTTADLGRVLGSSYWAQGRSQNDVKMATDKAISVLRQRRLIRPVGTDAHHAWSATALGQAMAAALLLPKDSEAIDQIVNVAENNPADHTWLPEVLFAACNVPSILSAARRPREEDVVTRRPMPVQATFKSFVRKEHGRFSFGFPRRPVGMPAGAALQDVLQRCVNDQLRNSESKALLRTYFAWLWAHGDPIDVKQYVRET